MDYSSKEDLIERFFEKIKGLVLPSETNNCKSKFLQSNTLLYCVVLVLALRIISVFVLVNVPLNIFFANITKATLEGFTNQTRVALGLPALVVSEKLEQVAQLKAQDMVQNQYFSHTSPAGVTPWHWFSRVGYNYKFAGENLAVGFYESEEAYSAWLNSPSHKANILNPNYKEVGIAVLSGFGQNNAIVVVQEFGSQLPAKATTVQSTKPTIVKQKTEIPVVPEIVKEAPAVDTTERVLSQSIESKDSFELPKGNAVSNLYSKFVNNALYNFDSILQNFVYVLALLVIGGMMVLVFSNINVEIKKELVFRSVLIIALLSVATVIDKDLLIAIIPHQIFT